MAVKPSDPRVTIFAQSLADGDDPHRAGERAGVAPADVTAFVCSKSVQRRVARARLINRDIEGLADDRILDVLADVGASHSTKIAAYTAVKKHEDAQSATSAYREASGRAFGLATDALLALARERGLLRQVETVYVVDEADQLPDVLESGMDESSEAVAVVAVDSDD